MENNNPLSICLWFNGNAAEAADFYCRIFNNSNKGMANPMVSTFTVNGINFMALNGGPHYTFNEAISLVVSCNSQEEIDYFWEKLTEGGEEGKCGWLKDKFGVSWQVVPSALGKIMSDHTKAQRATKALMAMKKLNIDELENA